MSPTAYKARPCHYGGLQARPRHKTQWQPLIQGPLGGGASLNAAPLSRLRQPRVPCRARVPSPRTPVQTGTERQPRGARKRPPSIAPDLKALLQAALSKKVTLTIGDKERMVTKAAAGIEQLVDQFAHGDRYARRDLFDLADKLGLDLGASSKALEELAGKALTADDEALVADFLRERRS